MKSRALPLDWKEVLALAGSGSLLFNISNGLSAPNWLSCAIAIGFPLLFTACLVVYRVWISDTYRFAIISSDEGEAANDPVESAAHLIQTTHFTSIVPYEKYVSRLIEKMDDGVKLRRIVARDLKHDKTVYTWLDRFKGKKNYEQIEMTEMFPIPIDIMIFDKRRVVLHLPSEESGKDFYRAVVFDNEDIAASFGYVFSIIENRARSQKP